MQWLLVKSHGAHESFVAVCQRIGSVCVSTEPFATADREGSLLPRIGDSGNQVNFRSRDWETEVQIQGKRKV